MVHKYRLLLKSSWGIAIDIDAEAAQLQSSEKGIVLTVQANVRQDEIKFLKAGLQLVAPQILGRCSGTRIVVNKIDYNPTDYQPEGIACAIAGWAAKNFGFEWPEVPV